MVVSLDLKDKKLLYELDMDARQTNAKLAKKLNLSKQAVQYRIDKLKEKGIIGQFYPVVNMPKLGYLYCRIFITLKDITDNEFKTMLAELSKDDRFFWIFSAQGSVDLLMAMWSKNITEFRNAIEDILIKYGKFIETIVQSMGSDVIHYQQRFLLDKKETNEIHVKETADTLTIDEEDKKILRQLCQDARMNVVDIARNTGISSRTVSYRIQRMEESNIISAYRTTIDHNLLGFTYYKLFIDVHNFTKAELKQINEFIKSKSCVVYRVEAIGFPEFMDVEVMVESSSDLFNFIKELREAFPRNIGHYRSFMFIDTVKVKFYPF